MAPMFNFKIKVDPKLVHHASLDSWAVLQQKLIDFKAYICIASKTLLNSLKSFHNEIVLQILGWQADHTDY